MKQGCLNKDSTMCVAFHQQSKYKGSVSFFVCILYYVCRKSHMGCFISYILNWQHAYYTHPRFPWMQIQALCFDDQSQVKYILILSLT